MPVIDLGQVVGPQGAPGATGATGATGAQGRPGQSAYELAVASGFAGTEAEWLASLKGDKGDVGPQGPAGQSAYQQAVAGGYAGTEDAFKRQLSELPTLVSGHSVAQYNAGDFEARQNVALNGGVANFSTSHRFSRITGTLTLPTVSMVIDDEAGEGVGDLTVFPSGAQQVFIDQVRRGNENIVMYFTTTDVSYTPTLEGGEAYRPYDATVRVEISSSTITVRYQVYLDYQDETSVGYDEQLRFPKFTNTPLTVGFSLWFRTCTA